MLLSLSRGFIFVANLKTGSSAIEAYLKPYCEVAISDTRFGKHQSYQEITSNFSWAFDHIRRSDFFVFGVIRDPVDYVMSIYNSHLKPDFIGFRHYTGNISFDEFYVSWMQRRSWQLEPQHSRFLDGEGRLALDYVLDYTSLHEQWPRFCRVLDVPAGELKRLNVSPAGIGRHDLRPAMIDRIYDDFEVDYELLRTGVGLSASRWP